MHTSTEQINANTQNANLANPRPGKTEPVTNATDTRLFSSLLDAKPEANQSIDIQETLKQLSTQLSQQLSSDGDRSDATVSLDGFSIKDFYIEDSNQDGELDTGDSLVAILSNNSGETTEVRLPLSEEDIQSLTQVINDSTDSQFMDAFMQGFIEMMMSNLYQSGQDLQNFLEKSREDYSWEVSV